MSRIEPLVSLTFVGVTTAMTPRIRLKEEQPVYQVICRNCGNVTRTESGGTVNDAPLPQANLYQRRHLAKHLEALAAEITEASR